MTEILIGCVLEGDCCGQAFDRKYERIAAAGFDATDTGSGDVQSSDPGFRDDPAGKGRLIRANGLAVVCYHSVLSDPAVGVPQNVTLHERHMDYARQLGCTLFLVHSRWVDFKPFDLGSASEWTAYLREDTALLPRLGEACAGRGLQLVVENNPFFPLAYYRDLFKDLARPHVAMCLDVGHANLQLEGNGRPVPEWVERLADRIAHLHLHSNDGKEDVHLPVLAGGGTVDWPAVFRSLKRAGYRGVLNEELPLSFLKSDEALEWALTTRGAEPLRALWAGA